MNSKIMKLILVVLVAIALVSCSKEESAVKPVVKADTLRLISEVSIAYFDQTQVHKFTYDAVSHDIVKAETFIGDGTFKDSYTTFASTSTTMTATTNIYDGSVITTKYTFTADSILQLIESGSIDNTVTYNFNYKNDKLSTITNYYADSIVYDSNGVYAGVYGQDDVTTTNSINAFARFNPYVIHMMMIYNVNLGDQMNIAYFFSSKNINTIINPAPSTGYSLTNDYKFNTDGTIKSINRRLSGTWLGDNYNNDVNFSWSKIAVKK